MSRRKRKRNRKPQTPQDEMTAVKEALLETREGRALFNELQRYKKEVASYFSGAKSKKETS